ncbi:hypothetical protein [Streptomyces sp. JW3]|uniref:hypothetical protein n=1 Tax=Streptomyces sp. JW3 TaxID=3456955 RepID=UPI003FA4C1B2
MRAQEERPGGRGAGEHRPVVVAPPVDTSVRGAGAPEWTTRSVSALQGKAGNAAVQRALTQRQETAPVQRSFGGELGSLGVQHVMAQLRSRYPGQTVRYSAVKAAYDDPTTVYSSIEELAAALGIGQAQQSTSAPAPQPAVTTPVTTPAPSAATPAGRPPRPPVKPKPAKLGGPGQQSSSAAVTAEQAAPVSTLAPPTRATAAPPVPVTAGERATSERVSVEDFAANAAQARDELDDELTTPRKYLRRRAANGLDDEVFQQMAKSVAGAGFDRKKVVRHLTDQLYSCLEWTGRAPIAVFTHEAQGKGDLMLGVKTADALRANFPRTERNKNDISLMTAEAAVTKQPGVFADAGHPFTVLPGTRPGAPDLPGRGPLHTVVAPQLPVTKDFEQSVGKWGSTASAMTEYSKPNAGGANDHTTGLAPKEVGITFDAGLRAYKKQQDQIQGEDAKRAARLENLQALRSPELLAGLFPENQQQAARDFAAAASSRLYFAYSNKSAQRFARTVAELERDKGHDVHIVQSTPKGMPELDDRVKAELAALGVGRVRVVTVDGKSSTLTSTDVSTGGTGKTMHWITTNRVPHDDMLTLIKASEPIMMATGNQSTSEALSAGKTIMYESIGMEQSQAFRQALYQGAGVSQSDIQSIAALSADFDQRKPALAPQRPQFAAAAAALDRMQEQDRMGKFSDQAAATKDLGRWVGGQHLRDYLMRSPLSAELSDEEAKLEGDSRNAGAYRAFVDHLLNLPGDGE